VAVQPDLPSGIPTLAEYDARLRTPFFATIRSAASAFLEENADVLAPYRRRWVSDPLHQWSRQWEYPYAWERVASLARGQRERLRVLDAGSGITFFPYTALLAGVARLVPRREPFLMAYRSRMR